MRDPRDHVPEIDIRGGASRFAVAPTTALGILAAVVFILAAYVLTTTFGVFVAAVFLVPLVLGVLTMPLIAYGLMDSVPLLSPLLGNLMLSLGFVALGSAVIHLGADDRYEVRYADDEYGPRDRWGRFKLAWVGLSFERDPDAYGQAAERLDLETLRDSPETDMLPGKRHPVDIERGGKQSFVRTDIDDDSVLVKWAQWVRPLCQVGDLELADRVHRKALEEHGGDTSQHGTKTMAAATFAFTVLGAAMGYVLFFTGGA